jgi:hypothetical protein
LNVVLSHHFPAARQITVVHRRLNKQASTFPSEIVTCRVDDGGGVRELKLFCKYSDPDVNHLFGHRSGVAFEAEVYRDILSNFPMPSPRYYGHHITADGRALLVLQALDEVARVHKGPTREAIVGAARWIGAFHAAHERQAIRLADRLHHYDVDYYRGWSERTSEFAGDAWHREFSWLAECCRNFERRVPEFLVRPGSQTIIHGEYYPKNILLEDGQVYPVDWESAAVAAGEVDFASMTENWPEDLVTKCAHAYCETRWPGGHPPTFASTVDAAQIYLHFRWLGNRAEWTAKADARWRFEMIKVPAERLGLI